MLNVDQLGIAIPSTVNFSARGDVDQLNFDAKGQTQLLVSDLVDDAIHTVSLTGLNLSADLSGASLPNSKMVAELSTNVLFDNTEQKLSLSNISAQLDENIITGDASVLLADVPSIYFNLQSQKLDFDALMGSSSNSSNDEVAQSSSQTDSSTTSKTETVAKTQSLSRVEPDLSALKSFNLVGDIRVDALIAANVKLNALSSRIKLEQGKATLESLNADLYDGKITAKGTLDATKTPAQYSVSKVISNVEIQPLLMDLGDLKLLAGKANINVNLNGVGLSELALRNAITGTVGASIADGQLYGVNIPEMIREASATLKGNQAEYVKEDRKTDFSELSGTFRVANGNAETRNLTASAPNIDITSEGATNLVNETLAFNVFVKLHNQKENEALKDLTIPVKVAGTWHNPTYSLDLQGLLTNNKSWQEKAKEEAQRGLQKLLGDKSEDENIKKITDGLLNSLFNK